MKLRPDVFGDLGGLLRAVNDAVSWPESLIAVSVALILATAGVVVQGQAVKPSQRAGFPQQSEGPRHSNGDGRPVITRQNVAKLVPIAKLEKDDIWRIAWSPARDRMGLVGWGTPVEVRGVVSLELHDTIDLGKNIIHFAFSPKRGVMAYSDNDRSKSAVILDRAPVRSIRLETGNDQPNVVFSPDGRLLATGGYGTEVKIWRCDDGKLTRTFNAGPTKGALTPVFSPDGRLLAIGNRNSTTGIFDVATGDRLVRLPKTMSHRLRFGPDGTTVAVVYVKGSVALWKADDGALVPIR
jgi:WD40 repeat protein